MTATRTSKERVRAKHPRALAIKCWRFKPNQSVAYGFVWAIVRTPTNTNKHLGRGKLARDAWVSAARKLGKE